MNITINSKGMADLGTKLTITLAVTFWSTDTALAAGRGSDARYLLPIAVLFLAWLAFISLVQRRREKPFKLLHVTIALWLAPLTFVLFLEPIREMMDRPRANSPEIASTSTPQMASLRLDSIDPTPSTTALSDHVNHLARCTALWTVMSKIEDCVSCSPELRKLPAEALRKLNTISAADAQKSLSDLARVSNDAAIRHAKELPSVQRLTDKAKKATLAEMLVSLSTNASGGILDELVSGSDKDTLRMDLVVCALQVAQETGHH